MFGKQPPGTPEPGKAQFAMLQTIAKMIGVPPETLAAAFHTIATAGERLERIEAKLDVGDFPGDRSLAGLLEEMEASLGRIERALGTGGYSISDAGPGADADRGHRALNGHLSVRLDGNAAKS